MKAKITAGTTYCDLTMQDSFIPAKYIEDNCIFWKDLNETEILISVWPPIPHPPNKFYVP